MQETWIEFDGKKYCLILNGTAMFELEELFGGFEKVIESIDFQNPDGRKNLYHAAQILMEQGELIRRLHGYDKQPILDVKMIETLAMPYDLISLRVAVISAISRGLNREVKDKEEEIDIGLQELQKKTI